MDKDKKVSERTYGRKKPSLNLDEKKYGLLLR